MVRCCVIIFFTCLTCQLTAQQLYVEVFSGRNRTNYDILPYESGDGYWPIGLRVAAGADHLQLGAEFSSHINKSRFEIRDTATNEKLGEHRFSSNYYGLFVRGKISRYPARRFGITLLAGLGYLDLSRQSTIETALGTLEYETTLCYNGGVGISLPSQSLGMVEVGYHYYHADFSANENLPTMIGSYHSIHLGFSLNFVFGKRKKAYKAIMKKIN
ncbi:MAG: hypothetical protein AAFZ15_19240 [Bacteroidota bacterium]